MTYADEIERLVEYNLRYSIAVDDLRMIPLLTALGCSTMERRDHEWIYKHTKPLPVNEDDEALIAGVLINLLSQITGQDKTWAQSHYSILEGLSRHDRWRACLSDREQTYTLAAIVLHYSHCKAHSPNEITWAMAEDVHCMLTQWLRPKTPWHRMPSLEETARAMFGDAWWDLVTGRDPDLKIFSTVLGTVLATQPDFLPRVLSDLPVVATLTLPSMDGR